MARRQGRRVHKIRPRRAFMTSLSEDIRSLLFFSLLCLSFSYYCYTGYGEERGNCQRNFARMLFSSSPNLRNSSVSALQYCSMPETKIFIFLKDEMIRARSWKIKELKNFPTKFTAAAESKKVTNVGVKKMKITMNYQKKILIWSL